MTKGISIALFLMLVLGTADFAKAQAVRFRLEIPAGINFDSRVLQAEPRNGNETILWVEMVSRENIEMLVSLRDEKGNFSKHTFFILTDGSGNFGNAREFGQGTANTTMMDQGRLVRNIVPKTSHLRSWIGVPARNGLVTTIEYF